MNDTFRIVDTVYNFLGILILLHNGLWILLFLATYGFLLFFVLRGSIARYWGYLCHWEFLVLCIFCPGSKMVLRAWRQGASDCKFGRRVDILTEDRGEVAEPPIIVIILYQNLGIAA